MFLHRNSSIDQHFHISLLYIETPETESLPAVEVSIVCRHKDNQFGIEFLRYALGDRERVRDLVEGRMPSVAPPSG